VAVREREGEREREREREVLCACAYLCVRCVSQLFICTYAQQKGWDYWGRCQKQDFITKSKCATKAWERERERDFFVCLVVFVGSSVCLFVCLSMFVVNLYASMHASVVRASMSCLRSWVKEEKNKKERKKQQEEKEIACWQQSQESFRKP
jgi:hypothetical protein